MASWEELAFTQQRKYKHMNTHTHTVCWKYWLCEERGRPCCLPCCLVVVILWRYKLVLKKASWLLPVVETNPPPIWHFFFFVLNEWLDICDVMPAPAGPSCGTETDVTAYLIGVIGHRAFLHCAHPAEAKQDRFKWKDRRRRTLHATVLDHMRAHTYLLCVVTCEGPRAPPTTCCSSRVLFLSWDVCHCGEIPQFFTTNSSQKQSLRFAGWISPLKIWRPGKLWGTHEGEHWMHCDDNNSRVFSSDRPT